MKILLPPKDLSRPKDLLRRLYMAVAILAFLPVALIVLPAVMAKALGLLLPLILVVVVIGLWRLVFGRGGWLRR